MFLFVSVLEHPISKVSIVLDVIDFTDDLNILTPFYFVKIPIYKYIYT